MQLRLPKANVEWRISDDRDYWSTELTAIYTMPDGSQMANTVRVDRSLLERSAFDRHHGRSYGDVVVDEVLTELERGVGRALVRGSL